jgi:hypothetical protein
MRITIETEEGSKPAVSTTPATTTTSMEGTGEAVTDGGGAPSLPGAAAGEGDQGSDGGGPPQALLDAIAVAEAAGVTAAMTPATEDFADGGAGPSAA